MKSYDRTRRPIMNCPYPDQLCEDCPRLGDDCDGRLRWQLGTTTRPVKEDDESILR